LPATMKKDIRTESGDIIRKYIFFLWDDRNLSLSHSLSTGPLVFKFKHGVDSGVFGAYFVPC